MKRNYLWLLIIVTVSFQFVVFAQSKDATVTAPGASPNTPQNPSMTQPTTPSNPSTAQPPSSSTAPTPNTLPDFRKTNWGMTVSQVKATEQGKPKADFPTGKRTVVVYVDSVKGLSCDVVYIFVSDKLVRAKYLVTTEHSNKTEYLSDFDKLSDSLKEKYGKPESEDTFWSNKLYKDDPSEWGMAVAVGHLVKYTHWELPKTTLVLSITGDNYEITLAVEYASTEFKSLENQANKEEDQEQL